MDITTIQSLCAGLPGVTEDIKWENHLCFCVGGKMFLILGLDEVPVTASFKTDEETFAILCGQPGFGPAPYLARNKWVKTDDIGRLSKQQWAQHITAAYQLIRSKLPKKVQAALQ